jgi:hypothetical protein
MDDLRSKSRARIAFAATIALLLLFGGLPPAHADDRSTLAPVVGSPPREDSPFTHPDAFCAPDTEKPPPGPRASAPGVTRHRITVVMLTPVVDPGATSATRGAAPGDPVAEARTFGQLVNKCGGILGRKLDLKVVEQTSNPEADCVRAVDQLHAFVVVSWTNFGGASCVADAHKTVMIASGTRAPNDALLTTQGRLAVASTSEGVLSARVLDLIQSGKLDKKRVAVLAAPGGESEARSVRRLLATADPSKKIAIVGSTTPPVDVSADVVITTAFDPSSAQLPSTSSHPLSVYSLGQASDEALDAVRIGAGVNAAKAVNDAGVYSWISPDLADYRDGKHPTRFATMCNDTYNAALAAPSTTSRPLGGSTTTTTTLPPALPHGPYLQVAEICLAWRIAARALYNAGPNPTQRSLVRALYRLPYIENVNDAPKARGNQVINEPVARGGHGLFLAKAEYPCTHPEAPRNPADTRMCWVPVSGWEDGHAVNAPL